MRKLVVLLAVFFLMGCDNSDCFDNDSDWSTDPTQPPERPVLTERGSAPGYNSGIKRKISSGDSDHYFADSDFNVNNLDRIIDPILDPDDLQSTK